MEKRILALAVELAGNSDLTLAHYEQAKMMLKAMGY